MVASNKNLDEKESVKSCEKSYLRNITVLNILQIFVNVCITSFSNYVNVFFL